MHAEFRTPLGATIFQQKYAKKGVDTWTELAAAVVDDVCTGLLTDTECAELVDAIREFKFVPGGRYLYYAGRKASAYFNCFLSIPQHDTRAQWAEVVEWATRSLMQGGGIGVDYSVFRPRDSLLSTTGGKASGPVALMQMVNEVGRYVMQGGSRRSAIYASLNWQHADADEFLHLKDWQPEVRALKDKDFNFPAALDMTNISLNYDDHFMARIQRGEMPSTYLENVRQALKTAEPGFSFNFGSKSKETSRNACTEVTSDSPYDSCNLGSLNMAACNSAEWPRLVELATKFLYCGTVRGTIDHEETREYQLENRRLGLGLMGMHEWLLQRHSKYEVTPELHKWLRVYQEVSDETAASFAGSLGCPVPRGVRAIAPTGSIGILAGTTTGVEPLFAVAYKRRYLKDTTWYWQYVVDGCASNLIERYSLDPKSIESAMDLAAQPERRLAFQADVQDYVDMAISSTLNLPAWGSEGNNEETVRPFAKLLAQYAPRLRGFTCYPDGARGGQPLTNVPYHEAVGNVGVERREVDICDITGKGGSCGV